MKATLVRDVMVPLDDVPTVRDEETLADAVRRLDAAQTRRPEGRSKYRAVLVVDDRGRVVGKLGHLAFLKAFEPGFERPLDLARLDRAGVDPDLVESISGHLRFWQDDLGSCCRRAAHLLVRDVMHPVDHSLVEDTPLLVAISTLTRLQTLSIPVRRGERVVGLLRLADLYDVIAELILGGCSLSGQAEKE